MQQYLSFGAGVNSVALGLWLIDHGIEDEWVYADHGADWPETRAYVAMLQERGYPITVLETLRDGLSLYDYYLAHHMVPLRTVRACTVGFKLRPLATYMQPPCVVYVGISADEARRVERIVNGQRRGEEKRFPLVDEGIDRAECRRIIERHGLPVPMRSGCFVCPFQRRQQWINLRTLHPDLYCQARRLEDGANAYLRSQGRDPVYLARRPLDQVCEADQMDMFDPERGLSPCLCELE